MTRHNEPVHPQLDLSCDKDGRVTVYTDPEGRGITQRLWVGTQLLAALVGKWERQDLVWLLDKASEWASAADMLAMALLDQQANKPGMLAPELMVQWLSTVEKARERRAREARARQELDERGQGEGETP